MLRKPRGISSDSSQLGRESVKRPETGELLWTELALGVPVILQNIPVGFWTLLAPPLYPAMLRGSSGARN